MRLTVETGPLAGTVVTLDRDQPTSIGSGPSCALRVQEAGVLPEHAVVKALRNEGFGLKALAPGVRCNGAQIEATPLADGDIIEIGTTRIAFGQTQKKGLPRIGGYRVLEELGRGGMGVVYRAEQVSLHREVALKVLSHDLTQDPQFVGKFVAEARAAAKLQHPNVVSVFDVEHDGDTYFYAMELMQNGSCEDWLKQNGTMPVERALQVVADAAAGLAYAESLGIVHRDIKPDNLMLDQHGVVKIADLGLAGTDHESEARAIGTPHFMAPEQVLRKGIDHRSDLYALGCTLYRLVTGRTPFRGTTVKDILRAQLKDVAEPAHKVNTSVPTAVSELIQRLMAKEPADRFQNANELMEVVDILLRPPHKKGLWIGLAAAAVLVAGGAIYWAVNKPKEQTIVEKYRDNPEMLKLATENEALQNAAREDAATIALLTVRVSGREDEPLADAMIEMARAHSGTRGAAEAEQRAAQLKNQVRERRAREQQLRTMVQNHLGSLEQNMAPQLLAHDYALAMRTLAAPGPAEIQADPDLAAGIAKLQNGVLAKARARLQELAKAIATAQSASDAAALSAAIDALSDNLAATARWPAELSGDLVSQKSAVADGRTALAGMMRTHRENLWDQYRDLFRNSAGGAGAAVAGNIDRFDFAAAAAAAAQFATSAPGDEAGTHAAAFADAAERASMFTAKFEQAAAAGKLHHELADGTALTSMRWDRANTQLVFTDPSKRPNKEQPIAAAALSPENWWQLSTQVEAVPIGERECFLTFVLLSRHATAAANYLSKLNGNDDSSGTGDAGYPLAADAFDRLLRSLPDAPDPWIKALRNEIEAAQRLTAGLRALSERRSLAAAGHLDKLFADHAHSFVVMVLP